jgi:NADPH:quinone reductase-like Zn-dependent oxidoreductase
MVVDTPAPHSRPVEAADQNLMKAFVLHSYGSSDRLVAENLARPVPAGNEVLVRLRATSINPYDWHTMRGEPRVARLMGGNLGLRRPKLAILGADVAGTVVAVGAKVTEFRLGDEVYALVNGGGFAEYVCVAESELTPKPSNLSFEQAAAVPLAASTALLGLRDEGHIEPGQRVLINGASGGVGTFAVQIAKALGAEVTGVCSAHNVELIRSIGADDVIDYTKEDFTTRARRYDLLLDIAGSRSASAARKVLIRKGTYVVVGGQAGRWIQPAGHAFSVLALSPFVPQRMALADLVRSKERKHNLVTLTGLIEDGKITPVIDRRFAFADIPAAVSYQEAGHAPGKVVVSMA